MPQLDEQLREMLKPYLIVAKNSNLPDFKLYDEEWLNQLIAKIKAIVVESLPKEVDVTDEDFNIPKGEPASISLLRADCYNQCLGEIRSILFLR